MITYIDSIIGLHKILHTEHFHVDHDISFISVFICYTMNLSMGQGAPGGLIPHTKGRLATMYGARRPLGTILLISNYNRYCCQMSQIFWYYIA